MLRTYGNVLHRRQSFTQQTIVTQLELVCPPQAVVTSLCSCSQLNCSRMLWQARVAYSWCQTSSACCILFRMLMNLVKIFSGRTALICAVGCSFDVAMLVIQRGRGRINSVNGDVRRRLVTNRDNFQNRIYPTLCICRLGFVAVLYFFRRSSQFFNLRDVSPLCYHYLLNSLGRHGSIGGRLGMRQRCRHLTSWNLPRRRRHVRAVGCMCFYLPCCCQLSHIQYVATYLNTTGNKFLFASNANV